MTARPIFPESRRRPIYAAVALMLVMVAVLLVAGCIGGDYKSDQDIHLIKLNQDGSVAWTKFIDSGKDDEVTDVIQTLDGGYIVAGGYSVPKCNQHTHFPTTVTLTRFSPEGNVLWAQNYALNGKIMLTNDPENIIAVFQTPDSGFLIVSQYGMITQLDNNGNIQWSRSIPEKRDLQFIIFSIVRTNDNGYLLAGSAVPDPVIAPNWNHSMMITKLDLNANQSWTKKYDNSGISRLNSLIELKNNSELVGFEQGSTRLVLFDNNGTVLGYPEIPLNGRYDLYKIRAVPDGFYIYVSILGTGNHMEELRFDNNGKTTGRRNLVNITYSTFLTKDEGYLTIDSGTDSGRARLLTANGAVIWDKEIISYKAKYPPITHVRRIIETEDGGFLVVYGVEKAIGC